MRNIIAGTAGHIDHGKTALVRALTGVDTDRLEEEKRRGISIDIGFASLTLGDAHIGLVDVPGHERFIKNMLAGVAGIDFVLFVVAADESIKPQTREHFEICRLLRIPRGIVVLTKADLVDADILSLVRLEVEEFVAGSFLEGAPVVPVSSVTGQGIAELKAAMERAAATVPAKDSAGYFRMPVDRSFSLRGFGMVVTGTLIAGTVSPEDEVAIYPEGRRVRVRNVQVHGASVQTAYAGQRTALNLAGIEPGEIRRGMVLAVPDRLRPTELVDTRVELLADAKPLKHRAPVHFHAGTAEIEAEARLFDPAGTVAPGTGAAVRFVLREPLLLLPGDRFILRMFSPVVTIGGGSVVESFPPRMRRAETRNRVQQLWQGGMREQVAVRVAESPLGVSLARLVECTGARPETILSVAPPVRRVGDWLVDPGRFEDLLRGMESAVAEFHRRNPLAPGRPREEARSGVMPELFEALIASSKTLVAEGDVVRLKTHRVVLKQDESEASAKIEGLFREAGLAVPGVNEVLGKSGLDAARARTILQMLLREKKLVRASDELVFHAGAIAGLKSQLTARKGQRFTVPEFKEWTGISRKYAIPLLELLDRERVTRRDGDTRIVL